MRTKMDEISKLAVPRLVKVNWNKQMLEYVNQFPDEFPWQQGDIVLFLGEVQNQPGHGVYVTRDGKVHYGWHTSDFCEPDEEEL